MPIGDRWGTFYGACPHCESNVRLASYDSDDSYSEGSYNFECLGCGAKFEYNDEETIKKRASKIEGFRI